MKAATIRKYLRPHPISRRWTTFNGAFQSALAVHEGYDPKKQAEALVVLGQDPEGDLLCVYCSAKAATWDHLENNVRHRRFSGFGNRIYNLVPACRTCNERKGGKNWKDFLVAQQRADHEEQARRLAMFAERNTSERFGWEDIVREFPDTAKRYAELLDRVKEDLRRADQIAAEIRESVAAHLRNREHVGK